MVAFPVPGQTDLRSAGLDGGTGLCAQWLNAIELPEEDLGLHRKPDAPYVWVGTMLGLYWRAIDRWNGMAQYAVRCLPYRPISQSILTSAVSPTGGTVFAGGDLENLPVRQGIE